MLSFFRKTIPSLLRLSNSEVGQPAQPSPHRRRSFPLQSSDVAGLRLICSSVDIHHSLNVLEAVAVIYSGDSETPADDGGRSAQASELALCPESLGFESSSDRTRNDLAKDAESPAADTGKEAGQSMAAGAGAKGNDWRRFPPFLSTLKRSGRPRFNLRSVRREGRLEIFRMRNDRPDIIRSRSDGCLLMHLDKDDHQEGEHCDDHDHHDDL